MYEGIKTICVGLIVNQTKGSSAQCPTLDPTLSFNNELHIFHGSVGRRFLGLAILSKAWRCRGARRGVSERSCGKWCFPTPIFPTPQEGDPDSLLSSTSSPRSNRILLGKKRGVRGWTRNTRGGRNCAWLKLVSSQVVDGFRCSKRDGIGLPSNSSELDDWQFLCHSLSECVGSIFVDVESWLAAPEGLVFTAGGAGGIL